MPRNSTKTANKAISQSIAVETVSTEPFSAEMLDELLDMYAVPVAHEAIKRALPDRVHHHIRRLLSSDLPADRAELLALMQGAKMSIAFAVFHSVLQSAKEVQELPVGEEVECLKLP